MKPEDVQKVLQSLGHTASQVAQSLYSRGIKGRRRSTCDCPVANMITRLGVTTVQVSRVHAVYVIPGVFPMPVLSVRLPSVVGDFVKNFDAGDYPDLEYPQ